MILIENWGQYDNRLIGDAYGHPYHPEGTQVTTSRIVKAEGLIVTTKSGSVYKLGEPSLSYQKMYKDIYGEELDKNNPIIMKG